LNTPTNLRTLYSVGSAEGKAASNKQAVTAFLKQYYSQSDLESWWTQYCPKGETCGKGLPKLVGDATTGSPGIEAVLDIETITGVAGNIESEFWGFSGGAPGHPQDEPFMAWLVKMDATSDADIPKVFSTSYGEDESAWSLDTATRLNTEFMKQGTRGISLFYASGDEGANCKGGKFVPETPSSSPYVTAVGGTEPASGFPSPGSESAIGLSSGGFSNRWAQPEWQKSAVTEYLGQSGLPAKSKGYNVSGRAYPDISAQATNFCVNPGGCGVAGTSCASPTAAALFSLLNDLRLQNGQSTLGFLNPLIYQNADAFQDITIGSSQGCGLFSSDGWPAKKGWDAATGVGTVNYAKLAKVVTNLPSGKAQASVVV
jgi:tripeptidyl-peptidase-1